MDTKKLTGRIIVASVVILGAYDIIVAGNSSEGDTLSEIIRYYSFRYPVVPFAFGFVCGHWFWGSDKERGD